MVQSKCIYGPSDRLSELLLLSCVVWKSEFENTARGVVFSISLQELFFIDIVFCIVGKRCVVLIFTRVYTFILGKLKQFEFLTSIVQFENCPEAIEFCLIEFSGDVYTQDCSSCHLH